jgi:hypothetical protein
VTPRQAERLQEALEARWPEATDVVVLAHDAGAQVQMKVDGRDHLFSVADGGTLLRLFLLNGLGSEL